MMKTYKGVIGEERKEKFSNSSYKGRSSEHKNDEPKSKKTSSKKNVRKKPKSFKKLATLLMLGTLTVAGIGKVTSEVDEHREIKEIEQNAADRETFRSFKNIDERKMGKYLSNEIKALYEKYPNLDEIIDSYDIKTRSPEFIEDIYRLYKAFLVDKVDAEVKNMDDVSVTMVDQYILQSDRLKEGRRVLGSTHKEQYKHITDLFVLARNDTANGIRLANEMYELLALELGVRVKEITPEEVEGAIKEHKIYYDGKNVYTKYASNDKNNKTQESDTEMEL